MEVSRCDVCQHVKKNLAITASELNPVPVKSPWYHIGIDFVGPITPTSVNGSRYILTISDYFTKWVKSIPTCTKCASGVANALFKVSMCKSF